MGIAYNPKIVTNGLVLALDAGNPKSKSYNVIANPENLGAYLGLRAGASISANSTAAPDGTQTADLLSTSGTDFGYYFPAFPVGNATHSFFLKPAGATNSFTFNHVGLARGGTFTFSTRTFSSLSGYTGSYEVLPNGWYLVNFHTTIELNIYYIEMSFDNISGAYVWGLQLTPFSYYLPYVPVSANRPQFLDNTLWQDMTGRGNNGTLTNGPIFSGANGGSLVFDGTDDYSTVSNNITPGTGNFAVSVWVYKTETVANRYVWDFGSNGGTLSSGTSVTQGFRYYNPSASFGSLYTAGPIHNINTWYNIVISRISGTTYFYSNGSLITSAADSGNIGSWGTTFNIGRYGGGSGYEHQGILSSLLVYKDKGLTAAEVQQNFNATRGRYGI
jgi:hypothetical protein